MKKKQYIYLLLSLGILSVLIFLLLKAQESEVDSTIESKFSDFAIEDTTSINKIIITDANGITATVEKIDQNHWQLNGKYEARMDAVRLILKTAKLISVKSEVPKKAEENVLKTMAVTFKKIEYFSNGVLLKTWYVGHRTTDGYGTNMLLQRPGEQRSTVPYIMEIKGFFGSLDTRFFCEEKEWREKVIYKLGPEQIKSIEFVNNDQSEYGFKIDIKGKNDFDLYNAKGTKVNGFDTVAIRAYLLNFRKIAFEDFNRGILSEKQEDSLRKAIPFAVITVTDNKGNSTKLKAYRKPPTEEQKNLQSKNYQWDVERLYAILPSDEVIIMQFGTYDKIWRAIVNFTNNPS